MSDFIIEDGVLRQYVGPGGDVTIPEGVTRIGPRAFLRCFCLKRVTIPGSVRDIGMEAFKGCASLSEVRLSVGLERIWASAFVDCSSLREIQIPASVTMMDCTGFGDIKYPFEGCARLEAVHVAGDNPAFCDIDGVMYNRALTDMFAFPWAGRRLHTLPKALRWIDGRSFTCPKETRIQLLCVASDQQITPEMLEEWPHPLQGLHFLADCEHQVELRPMNGPRTGSEPEEYLLLVRAIVPPGETEFQIMGDTLVRWCGLGPVARVPDGVTEIGPGAFRGCLSVERIFLPDTVRLIRNDAFRDCKMLWAIRLPRGLTRISHRVFSGCIKLHSVDIPESVRQIGGGAFWGCRSLASVLLPPRLEEIGDGAFNGCESLSVIALPDGLRRIGRKAFKNSAVTSVRVPESVTALGAQAFCGCVQLIAAVLPKGLKTLWPGTFRGCEVLREVRLPEAVEQIDKTAFEEISVQIRPDHEGEPT